MNNIQQTSTPYKQQQNEHQAPRYSSSNNHVNYNSSGGGYTSPGGDFITPGPQPINQMIQDRNGNKTDPGSDSHEVTGGRRSRASSKYDHQLPNNSVAHSPAPLPVSGQTPNPMPRKLSHPVTTTTFTYQNIPGNSKAVTDPSRPAVLSNLRMETATPNRFHLERAAGHDSEADSLGDFRRSASARLPAKARFNQEDSDENKKNNSDQVNIANL